MASATSMVVEAALSVIFQLLAPPFLESLRLLFGVEKEAKRLKSTHSRIEALLTDAERRQSKQESDRLWLSDLKDVAYDIENILDELECRALGSKIEEAPIQTRKRKLTDRFRVTDLFSLFSSKFELVSRIKKIRESLDEIERESNQFRLRVIPHGPETERLRMRPQTSSIVDESSVFGREADREKVVGLLASDDSSASDSVIQRLSDDDCWSIFESLAFVEGDSDAHPDLVKIGKEIVNKCKGLPLAVKTLGGLVRSKVNVADWKSILECEIWDLL